MRLIAVINLGVEPRASLPDTRSGVHHSSSVYRVWEDGGIPRVCRWCIAGYVHQGIPGWCIAGYVHQGIPLS